MIKYKDMIIVVSDDPEVGGNCPFLHDNMDCSIIDGYGGPHDLKYTCVYVDSWDCPLNKYPRVIVKAG